MASAGTSLPTMPTENPPEKSLTGHYLDVVHVFFAIIPIVFTISSAALVSNDVELGIVQHPWNGFLFQFGILVFPVILSVTFGSWLVDLMSLSALIAFVIAVKRNRTSEEWLKRESQTSLGERPHCLTLIRSSINILTSVCILAVDFRAFPIDFMKNDTFGCGLMDTGIGLFVFSMGVVSRPLQGRKDLGKLLRTVAPILLLGLLRTVVIQAIDYHQDEKEYGTHLNAFFILGLTKLIGSLFSYFLQTDVLLIIGSLSVAALHESILQKAGLDFVFNPDIQRNSFVTSNREGLISLPGFIAIYIFSIYLKNLLNSKEASIKTKLQRLFQIATIAWILVLVLIPITGVSRRVANSAYLVWVIALVCTLLILFILQFDLLLLSWLKQTQTKDLIPAVIEFINYNGLVFFLVSNILTGGVNIFLAPRNRDDLETFIILSVYMFIGCFVVRFLYNRNIRIG